MPEVVAAATKGGASCKVKKQSLTKVIKKWRKSREQSCSTYTYSVLTQIHPSARISSKAMSIMNPFIIDIFERITSLSLQQVPHHLGNGDPASCCQGYWPSMPSPKARKRSPNTPTPFRSIILKLVRWLEASLIDRPGILSEEAATQRDAGSLQLVKFKASSLTLSTGILDNASAVIWYFS
ncbi:putative histone H2B type 2-D [Carcharodon carcharias]|uniref:putative histone H2B type 2-D n=1 Tax=Carcharodon carcharias TaxID=13397 RepID=UPI001B7EBCED|nr:putative histone H2B type 2-D [Carcharodon carcharias]